MLNLLECFDVIFNPSRYSNIQNLCDYGTEQLDVLFNFYSDLVDKDRLQAHFLPFKHFVKSYNFMSFEAFLKILLNDFHEQYPDFVKLGKIALIVPVSSAPCERGFSVQNSVKTKTRNRLNPERLNRLMFIKLVGPNLENFDFPEAARLFNDMKERNK